MLGNSRVHPVLLATDLARAREFYHDKLGLEILVEDDGTQIGWEVNDLRAELDELRSRGVTIEDYDLPGLKTENGIADVGFALMAWIIDPGKNALAIIERKG